MSLPSANYMSFLLSPPHRLRQRLLLAATPRSAAATRPLAWMMSTATTPRAVLVSSPCSARDLVLLFGGGGQRRGAPAYPCAGPRGSAPSPSRYRSSPLSSSSRSQPEPRAIGRVLDERHRFFATSCSPRIRNARLPWDPSPASSAPGGRSRFFHTEAEYHQVADSALLAVQDAVDEAFESGSGAPSSTGAEYELTLASGVLTLTLPGHGTWVLNKQTPNRQIWWSSPLSGPKRFEYLGGSWCSTKDGLALGPLLAQELRHVHPWLDVEIRL